MKTFFTIGGKLVSLPGGHNAGELAILHRGRLACFFHNAFFVQIDRRETRAHRAFIADDEAYVFARQLDAETVIIALNRDKQSKQVTIPVALRDEVTLKSVIGEGSSRVVNGEATLNLPPQTAVAFKTFDRITGFSR